MESSDREDEVVPFNIVEDESSSGPNFGEATVVEFPESGQPSASPMRPEDELIVENFEDEDISEQPEQGRQQRSQASGQVPAGEYSRRRQNDLPPQSIPFLEGGPKESLDTKGEYSGQLQSEFPTKLGHRQENPDEAEALLDVNKIDPQTQEEGGPQVVSNQTRRPYNPKKYEAMMDSYEPMVDSYDTLALTFEELTENARNQVKNFVGKRYSSLVVVENRYDGCVYRPWATCVTGLITLVVFFASLHHNDCPGRSRGCISQSLIGRLAFESTRVNALYGPRPDSLVDMGAKDVRKILYSGEVWRLVGAIYLHSGMVHLVGNLAALLMYGWRLESSFGAMRFIAVWILSGTFATICSGAFLPDDVTVGASGAVCGLIGASIAELLHNWSMYESSWVHLIYLLSGAALELFIGLAPYIDNITHIGGFVMGILLGLILLVKERFKEERAITGPDRGSRLRTKLPIQTHQWCLVFGAIPLVTLLYLIAIILLFSALDMDRICPGCHKMNCVETVFWDCPDASK